MQAKVGQSFVFLDGTRRSCGLSECNLGNLITDAILFHYVQQSTNSTQWSGVSIAIFNSITASIDPTTSGNKCVLRILIIICNVMLVGGDINDKKQV